MTDLLDVCRCGHFFQSHWESHHADQDDHRGCQRCECPTWRPKE